MKNETLAERWSESSTVGNFMRDAPIVSKLPHLKFLALGLWAAVFFVATNSALGVILYQTGFEVGEGYQTNKDLVGQNGWIGAGSGGNGIVAGFFPGKGQQAYIGYQPPDANVTNLFIYQPINKALAQMRCLVTMAIIDSSNTNWDDFYWSVYNQKGKHLFTLDFDNFELKLYYRLDGTNNRTWSGLTFSNAISYKLSVLLDFAGNRWSAIFDNKLVATNQPITTIGADPNLGDFDVAWVIYDPTAPGDNFMVFDDYQISATVPQPQLKLLGLLNGSPTFRLTGPADNSFAIDTTTNLINWLSLKTNITTGGSFDYSDDNAVGLPRRFYRGRWVP
jgi:hypothetical protein